MCLGEYVSPSSSRFITSHDQYSGSTVVIEMFFKAIAQYKPDLVIFSGVHLLEGQPRQVRLEKLRLIKRSLLQVDPLVPIHLQLGSMGDASHVHEVLYRVKILFLFNANINVLRLFLMLTHYLSMNKNWHSFPKLEMGHIKNNIQ